MVSCLINPFILLPSYIANASDFDGTNDYLIRGTDLTGVVDSKKGIFSCFFRLDSGDASLQDFYGDSDGANSIVRNTSNKIRFFFLDATTTVTCLDMATSNSYTSSGTWHSLLASWDLALGVNHLYIDGVSDLITATNANTAIGYSHPNHDIGAVGGGSNKFNGCLSEIYFNMGEYLDFSDSGNRAKFITGGNKPVNLGTDGSTPTGTAPIIYLKNAAASFGTNSGTGGNFTITGSLDVASTSPSD